MKTEYIPYILTVVSTGSINKASIKLNYPVQKLCNIMTNIENEFETQFFIRSHTGVQLTHEGEIFLEGLKKINEELIRIKEAVHKTEADSDKNISGEITLYILALLDETFFVECFKAFREAYPNIRLKIQTENLSKISEKVASDTGSIGITVHALSPSRKSDDCLHWENLLFYPLFRCMPEIVCKKDSKFLDKRKMKYALKELANIPYIALIEETFCEENGHPEVCIIKSKELFLEKLHQGDCFSLIGLNSRNRGTFLKKYPNLCTVLLKDKLYFENTVLVNHNEKLEPAGRIFLNFLFDFRDSWFKVGDQSKDSDYLVYEKPVF